ncbi:MAG TPA: A24 family peptidase [Candidatus Binatia bacterium]|nr:A24 family peptidase [Candidatus Binatia bacterium]
MRRPLPLAGVCAIAALLALLALGRLGPGVRWALLLPVLAALALVTVLDLRSRIIPDVVTLPTLAYALALAAARGLEALGEAALGAVAGGGVVLVVAVVSRGAMGGGDIKLMALLGASLGWQRALLVLAASQIIGGAVALVLLAAHRATRKTRMPVGAIIALLGGLLVSAMG